VAVLLVAVMYLAVGVSSSWVQSQEAEEAEEAAVPIVQRVTARDGSTLLITTVTGTWGACRTTLQYWEQAALRGQEYWYTRMQEYEAKNSCVTAGDGDLVLVGPSDVPGTLVVGFRARKDVRSALAWYVDCAAVPGAEDLCFRE